MKIITNMTPKEFAEKYYKTNKLHGRDNWYKEFLYSDIIIKGLEQKFKIEGECGISRHESILDEYTILKGDWYEIDFK